MLNARNLTRAFLLCNQRQDSVVVFVLWWRDPSPAASLEKLLHAGCRNRQFS